MEKLNEILNAGLKFGGPEFYRSRVPAYVYSNLKTGFGQRLYQQEAFGRFIFYMNEYHDRPKGVPIHLLFHMATGSGKTIIMAGLLLFLYEQGFRNFLFFVNSSNIIEKTRVNFLNPLSSKYLFSETLSIGEKQIRIREVENFQAVNGDDINIVFSTIQGLHIRLNTPKENSLTYSDFEDKKIVLISDEAHHINAETKKGNDLSIEEKDEIVSWEGTIKKIFYANSENILLEFTATVDLDLPEIASKYSDKLIFDYPLKQFRIDGFSKEVKVLQADLLPFERALQGVLLSQYRRKIFEKYQKIVKPVILFKSKTIKESQAFFQEFNIGIKNLDVAKLKEIKASNPDEIIKIVFKYFAQNNITLENLVIELQEDFCEEKLISVNSKDESEHKQVAVNSLEEEINEYRAVFAVDKLNEGWDVLNLFDIVRLYDTRDAKNGNPGKTTMSEAQLIGRGARYYPFQITSEQQIYNRKFDDDLQNELRICEELYYHSAYNPRYIQELNTALEEIGIKPKQIVQRSILLKESFKENNFYKTGLIFLNEQKKYNREDVFCLKSSIIKQSYKVKLKTGYSKSSAFFGEAVLDEAIDNREKTYLLYSFGANIIRKGLNKLEFYQFSNLLKYFPNLKSISEFITSPDYLGSVKVDIIGLQKQIDNLSIPEKLAAATNVLEEISILISSDNIDFIGTKEFKPYLISDRVKDKTVNFAVTDSDDKEYGKSMSSTFETNYFLDLSKRDWYVFNDCFGTSEEKLLIKYIDKIYDVLKKVYENIYLVRNERHFKIYEIDGSGTLEPDFVLFLTKPGSKETVHYQIFIEPKGGHLLKKDEWKEQCLKKLKDENMIEQVWKMRKYTIWGMPFYNEKLRKTEFDHAFQNSFLKPKEELPKIM